MGRLSLTPGSCSHQDWHVDMAASSVYYHVVRGEKVFYFSASRPPPCAVLDEAWLGLTHAPAPRFQSGRRSST